MLMTSDPPAQYRNEIFCSRTNRTEWFVPVFATLFFMTETNARPGRHGPRPDAPPPGRQVRPPPGDVRPAQPVKRADGRAVRPDPRRAPAGPGAARRLAGVRAGGRDQVRRPRAHRRTAAPVPGAHP